MNTEDIIERLHRRYPFFRDWIVGFADHEVGLTELQFAVVDAYRRGAKGPGISDLYIRLQMEAAVRLARGDHSMRMPTLREFDRIVRLHLAMIFEVPWQSMVGSRQRRTR
jgi:hypothetical protein